MANTVLRLQGGARDLDEDVEVYVDLDAASAPAFDAHVDPPEEAMPDFMLAAGSFLSAFTLSGYSYDDDGNPFICELSADGAGRPITGRDWLSMNERRVYEQLGPDGDFSHLSAFSEKLAPQCIECLYGVLSSDPGKEYDLTEQTSSRIGAAVNEAARSEVTRMNAAVRSYMYKASKLVNVNAVKNSIRQIFTWIPGERIINPEFGSLLRRYLYEPITDENQEKIVAEIRQVVLRWEPRVVVDRVVKATETDDVENNTVKLDIYYTIKGLNGVQFKYQYEHSRNRYSYI